MRRKIAGTLIVAIGLSFVIATLTARLFTVAPAFERMTAGFRPQMNAQTIQALERDLAGLTAVQKEFVQKAVPSIAAALKLTPAQLTGMLGKQFPAVTAGMAAVPQIGTQFGSVLTTLQNEVERFAKADAIPTSSLPATTVPWMLLGAGILTIGAGIFVLRSGRLGPILAVVLGALLFIAPLAMSLPSKANAADTMNNHLKPVYTASLVTGAQQSLGTMQSMGTEMQTKMLPALSGMLGLSPAQLQAYLQKNFPVLSQGLAGMPAALSRFGSLVATFGKSLPDYNAAKDTTLTWLVWLMIGGGLACFVFGAVGSERERADVMTIRRFERAA